MSTVDTRSTNLPLLIGFVLLLLMMVVQAGLALNEIRSIRNSMESIVDEKLVKSDLAQTMLAASRERGLILTLIYYEDDPFERDELKLRFSQYAGDFLAAREKLYAMKLSERERAALDELQQFAKQGTPAMERVLELILQEEGMSDADRAEAMDLMQKEAIPAREQVGAYLREVTEITRESSQQAIVQAERNYHRVWNQMLLLAVGIVLLSAGIIVVVYRKITAAAKEVERVHRQMRQQVTETVSMFKVSVALIKHSMSGGDHSIREMIDRLSQKARVAAEVRQQVESLQQWRREHESDGTDKQHDLDSGDELAQIEERVDAGCDSLNRTLDEAIVTFQDFDRVSQQLSHIGNSLSETAELLSDPARVHVETEWNLLRERMRENFVMMDAQVLYDAIMNGEDKEEALRKARQMRDDSMDNFEMF